MAKPTNPAVLLAWGDDLLLIEEAVDALAQQLAAGGMGAPDRVRLKAEGRGSGDGAAVLSNLAQKLGTGGLFGGGSLMVVAGAGRLARTKELRAGVASALANIAPGNAVALVDQRARRPNLRGARPDGPGELGLLVQDVGGAVLSCISPGPGELASWILQRAQIKRDHLPMAHWLTLESNSHDNASPLPNRSLLRRSILQGRSSRNR